MGACTQKISCSLEVETWTNHPTYPGCDKSVSVVNFKTINGPLTKPVNKISSFPMQQ